MRISLTGKRTGYTLVEILIALVLISITLAIVLPSFDKFLGSVASKTTPKKILNILINVRDSAIISGEKQSIDINKNKIIYIDKTGEKIDFSHGVNNIQLEKPQDNKIEFYPDGTSSGGSMIFKIDEGKKYRIKIDSVTGRPQMEEIK